MATREELIERAKKRLMGAQPQAEEVDSPTVGEPSMGARIAHSAVTHLPEWATTDEYEGKSVEEIDALQREKRGTTMQGIERAFGNYTFGLGPRAGAAIDAGVEATTDPVDNPIDNTVDFLTNSVNKALGKETQDYAAQRAEYFGEDDRSFKERYADNMEQHFENRQKYADSVGFLGTLMTDVASMAVPGSLPVRLGTSLLRAAKPGGLGKTVLTGAGIGALESGATSLLTEGRDPARVAVDTAIGVPFGVGGALVGEGVRTSANALLNSTTGRKMMDYFGDRYNGLTDTQFVKNWWNKDGANRYLEEGEGYDTIEKAADFVKNTDFSRTDADMDEGAVALTTLGQSVKDMQDAAEQRIVQTADNLTQGQSLGARRTQHRMELDDARNEFTTMKSVYGSRAMDENALTKALNTARNNVSKFDRAGKTGEKLQKQIDSITHAVQTGNMGGYRINAVRQALPKWGDDAATVLDDLAASPHFKGNNRDVQILQKHIGAAFNDLSEDTAAALQQQGGAASVAELQATQALNNLREAQMALNRIVTQFDRSPEGVIPAIDDLSMGLNNMIEQISTKGGPQLADVMGIIQGINGRLAGKKTRLNNDEMTMLQMYKKNLVDAVDKHTKRAGDTHGAFKAANANYDRAYSAKAAFDEGSRMISSKKFDVNDIDAWLEMNKKNPDLVNEFKRGMRAQIANDMGSTGVYPALKKLIGADTGLLDIKTDNVKALERLIGEKETQDLLRTYGEYMPKQQALAELGEIIKHRIRTIDQSPNPNADIDESVGLAGLMGKGIGVTQSTGQFRSLLKSLKNDTVPTGPALRGIDALMATGKDYRRRFALAGAGRALPTDAPTIMRGVAPAALTSADTVNVGREEGTERLQSIMRDLGSDQAQY